MRWRSADFLEKSRNLFSPKKKKSHGVVTPKRHSGFPKRTPRNPMAARVSRTSSVEVGFIGSEAVEWILGFDGFVDDYFWWKTALQFATEKVVLGPKKECNSSIRLPIIISRGLCWFSVENCDGDDGEWWRWWWWWWWWMMVMIVMVVNDSDDGDDGVGGQWWWWWWGVRGDDEEEDTRSSDNDNNDDDNDGDDDNDDDNAVGGGGGYDDVYIWHQQLWIVVMIVFIMASLLSVNHHHSRNISLTGCFAARHRFMSTKHHTPMMPCDFRWFHSQCRVFLLVIWWILWLVFFSWMKERDLKGRLQDVFGLYIYFGWMIVEIDQLWLDMDRKDMEICSTLSFQDIYQDVVLICMSPMHQEAIRGWEGLGWLGGLIR